MSLRAQLVLFGALVPTTLLVLAVVVAGALFERSLESALDEAIATQAAVEAVSLFDGPEGPRPHVHLGASPLGPSVDGVASDIAVYDRAGTCVVAHPPALRGPPTLRPDDVGTETPGQPVTRTRDGLRFRELSFVVRAPSGERYAVWLGHDLTSHLATLSAFRRSAFLAVALVGLLLLSLQLWATGRLHARLAALLAHVGQLREGRPVRVVPDAGARDELSTLETAILGAANEVHRARTTQERLVADAAHELRTPLATMRAAIDVTLRRERSPAELRESLEGLREEVVRLSALATTLLDLAALRARDAERLPLDLIEVVRQAVSAAEPLALAREMEIALEAPAECTMRGSPREIRQALDNLLANALEHGPPRTRIDVAVQRAPERVRIVVRDRGPGVPEDAREAIFEPFHRARPLDADARPGAGLGLAIVRDVAQRHGGHAFVERREDAGAAIGLELALGDR
ncbi:MAG: HAMP domain-containing sensor histidine kinase [Sandaracinus sp.]